MSKEERVDYAEPPQIVFEEPSVCADVARTRDVLRRTLAPAKAPRAAWTVTMRTAGDGAGTRAEGEIVDAAGAPVAHRVFTQPTRECAPLARAVGVWASLVLDAEVERARNAPPPTAAAPPKPAPAPEPLTPPLWPAPALNERPSPEQNWKLQHPEGSRSFEIGVVSFLMGGTGTGALAGPGLYTVIEVSDGIFLRPMLAFGRTIEALKPSADVYGTWGAARFDACLRMPGLYLDRRGIQLDTCAGADIGFLHFDNSSSNDGTPGDPPLPVTSSRTIPFVALGPSLGLRGELASELSVELRGVIGLNLVREAFNDPFLGSHVDPPLFNGRAELGLSWRVR